MIRVTLPPTVQMYLLLFWIYPHYDACLQEEDRSSQKRTSRSIHGLLHPTVHWSMHALCAHGVHALRNIRGRDGRCC